MNLHSGVRRALRCTALVILLASAGVASGQLADVAPRGNWDTLESTGDIVLDNESYYAVYQGEDDIDRWLDVDGDEVGDRYLEGEGVAEGDELHLGSNVDRDQRTGPYGDGEVTARVREPRITRMEMYDERGIRLGDGGSVRRGETVLIAVTSNYAQAEDLDLELRDPDGLDATRLSLTTDVTTEQESLLPSGFNTAFLDRTTQGLGSTGHETGYWAVDTDELDGGRSTVTVEGVDDLDFGRASESLAIQVGDEDRPSLALDREQVSRGENVIFDVRGSRRGDYHAVSLDSDRVRDGASPERLFRLVGETVEVGETEGRAYAVLEMRSGGVGTGQIDGSLLRTGSADVVLHEAADSVESARESVGRSSSEVDSYELDVEEGHLTISLEGAAYAPGQSVDVVGTASRGIDRVAVYVRDRDDWEILPLGGRDTQPVGSDGRWGRRNVVLSEEDYGGRILRFPGSYSVAAVDAADLSTPPPRSITPSEFNRLTTSRSTVRADSPRFTANFEAPGGEIALGDRVGFSGTSVGPREIGVVFVGERGEVAATTVRTNRGDLIEDVDLDVGDLRRGRVTALAVSPGRDGVYGTGSASDGGGRSVDLDSVDAFVELAESFDDRGLSGSQVVERLRDASVDRRGSDDLVVQSSFRIASPRTEVRDVVPAGRDELVGVADIETGERVLVRGVTNRNPRETDIELRLTGEDDEVEGFVERWDATGVWSTSLDTEGLPTGVYRLSVDDGESTDSVDVRLVERRQTGDLDELDDLRERLEALRRERDEIARQEDDLREALEDLEQENERLRDEIDELETDDEEQPGFTAVAVGLALLTTLAWRRRRGTR